MLKVSEITEQIVNRSPFLESSIAEGIINLSSLARKIQPEIENILGKEVQEGSIVMALKRYTPSEKFRFVTLKKVMSELGDIIVRSNIIDYTFSNSDSLIDAQKKLLDRLSDRKGAFFSWVQGINESNIIISNNCEDLVEEIFSNETRISKMEKLSSITIYLPEDNNKIPGIYYTIFKQVAWHGVSIIDVISTTNEFTIIIEDEHIDKVFSVLKNINGTI